MTEKLLKIHRALISVSNKSDILKFAQTLSQYNIQLLASEGTAKTLSKSGLKVTTISQYTNFPEIMNGRIKTLHTKIYAGILANPKIDNDIIQKYSIKPIDMVIVNFYPYPFSSITSKQKNINNNIDDMLFIDNIDIGGPSIVRSAAKNYKNVVVIVNNNDYTKITDELKINNGKISIQTRLKLADTAFQYVSTYDSLISDNFKKQIIKNQKQHNNKKTNIYFPDYINCMNINFVKKENMRYGENPHQTAAFYTETQNLKHDSISQAKQIQGKKLSYNNIVDIDTALECVKTFTKPTCVIIKHGIPCGIASGQTILQAYEKAYQTDPTSAFGGIIALNKNVDKKTAQTIINRQFTEAIIAPFFDQDSLKILNDKKNIRILKFQSSTQTITQKNSLNLDFKCINGGLLIQNKDVDLININNIKIVTKRQPTNQEINDAIFCWKVIKFVKSNAIIYGYDEQTIGIGSGQTSRIFAGEIATLKAKNSGIKFKKGLVMASDAFLPFPDTVDIANSIGTTCIIQPGGSIQDKQVINNADKKNISMIFTYMRHFRH